MSWLKRVRIPDALLRSLLGKYPWERYEPPYPPSYRLNSTITVLLGEWLWHKLTYKGLYPNKQRNQRNQLYQFFNDCSQCTNYNWYHRHPHVP